MHIFVNWTLDTTIGVVSGNPIRRTTRPLATFTFPVELMTASPIPETLTNAPSRTGKSEQTNKVITVGSPLTLNKGTTKVSKVREGIARRTEIKSTTKLEQCPKCAKVTFKGIVTRMLSISVTVETQKRLFAPKSNLELPVPKKLTLLFSNCPDACGRSDHPPCWYPGSHALLNRATDYTYNGRVGN